MPGFCRERSGCPGRKAKEARQLHGWFSAPDASGVRWHPHGSKSDGYDQGIEGDDGARAGEAVPDVEDGQERYSRSTPPDGARAAFEWMRDIVPKPALDSFEGDPPDQGFQCEYLAALWLLDRHVRRQLGEAMSERGRPVIVTAAAIEAMARGEITPAERLS
jgi:hypothetical protein